MATEKKSTTKKTETAAPKKKAAKVTKEVKVNNIADVYAKKAEYFNLKMDIFAGKEKNVNKLKQLRKLIARALTKLNTNK